MRSYQETEGIARKADAKLLELAVAVMRLSPEQQRAARRAAAIRPEIKRRRRRYKPTLSASIRQERAGE